MTSSGAYERPAIAGSGTIACGLAACASAVGEVTLLARSEQSAERARSDAARQAAKAGRAERITVTTDAGELAGADLVVEAIAEELDAKCALLAELGALAPEADLATTTSSLSIAELGARGGVAGRLYGLHVFNPVPRMRLIELILPADLRAGAAERARGWCEALGKTAVEVPDTIGFVVNRLLFPFLFDAARFAERNGLEPAAVDECMRLGAGHPMGPLALLDFIGLDVAEAIGDSLFEESGERAHRPPEAITRLVAAGRLGRKSGAGFYEYDA